MKFNRQLALTLAGAALIPFGVSAQTTSIIFDNTTTPDGKIQVPILNNTQIQFDANGNLIANCELDAENADVCVGLSVGNTGSAPTLTLSANPTSITAGQTSTLTWSTGNSPQVCVPTAGSSFTTWTGTSTDVKLKAVAGGSQTLSFASTGTYNLSLRCWNEAGASELRTATVTVASGGGGQINGCQIPDSYSSVDGWYKPSGYTARQISWSSAFTGTSFYTATADLHAIGARNISNQSMASNYIYIPFVAGTNAVYDVKWEEAQAITGYNNPRPAQTVYVTISPCIGDFRKENNTAEDPFLKRGCRRGGQATAINFRTDFPNSTTSYCALTPGEQYYMNIIFADHTQEVPGVTCITGSLCEANFRPR